ncbi:MAG: tRNA 2-thiocytidine biosynthesis TtcA family protein [Bacteroidaceae bacterium]|jgi:tRNA(Ile)-lysidine synthase TilS/MesJ|nr:tRNA 2-thiocytidine biosynthesis TtcA family protein [Bacteroidaceae bacterium]
MKTKADILEGKIRKLFNKGCVKYDLLEDGDKILIAVSGGKDSLELVRLLSQRAKIYKPHIQVEAAHIIMDNIPYETDRSYIQQFCEEQGTPLHILHSSFQDSTDERKTRCFLCSWNRRKTLFEFAVQNGFNKIALGHHMDDILTTYLMNVTFEGSSQTMTPKLQMQHYPITIIRPLCMVHEHLLSNIAQELGFAKQKTPCPYEETTQRAAMNNILHKLEEINKEARYSIWNALKL